MTKYERLDFAYKFYKKYFKGTLNQRTWRYESLIRTIFYTILNNQIKHLEPNKNYDITIEIGYRKYLIEKIYVTRFTIGTYETKYNNSIYSHLLVDKAIEEYKKEVFIDFTITKKEFIDYCTQKELTPNEIVRHFYKLDLPLLHLREKSPYER